jgi:hypothetical protein
MSSVFRIYGLKACFYGSPHDMFFIEHGTHTITMDDARFCRTYIENNIQDDPLKVYEFILQKLKKSGYNMAFFEEGGGSNYIENNLPRHRSLGDYPDRIKQITEAAERKELLDSLSSNFWGNIIVGELLNARD